MSLSELRKMSVLETRLGKLGIVMNRLDIVMVIEDIASFILEHTDYCHSISKLPSS